MTPVMPTDPEDLRGQLVAAGYPGPWDVPSMQQAWLNANPGSGAPAPGPATPRPAIVAPAPGGFDVGRWIQQNPILVAGAGLALVILLMGGRR